MVRGCSQCSPSDAGCLAELLGAIRAQAVFTLWEDAGKSHERQKHVPLESQVQLILLQQMLPFLKNKKIK